MSDLNNKQNENQNDFNDSESEEFNDKDSRKILEVSKKLSESLFGYFIHFIEKNGIERPDMQLQTIHETMTSFISSFVLETQDNTNDRISLFSKITAETFACLSNFMNLESECNQNNKH